MYFLCTKTGRRWGSWTKRSPRWSCKQCFLCFWPVHCFTNKCNLFLSIVMWFLSIELFWVPDLKICAHICIFREYWCYLKSKQMICFLGAETSLTKSELNQMHIQISIHNSNSHTAYFLSVWASLKYVTADMRTYPNPCCFENIFQTSIYSKISLFFFLLLFFSVYFYACFQYRSSTVVS